MTTIGLVIRKGNKDALELGKALIDWVRERSLDLVVDSVSNEDLENTCTAVSIEELVHQADPIVTLGGDGTLIGVARHVHGKSPLLVGVNFGHLGFLTEVAPAKLFETLEEVLEGRILSEERRLLNTVILRDGKVIAESQAVNDVVVQKEARSRLLDFDFSVDGEDVARIRADGLIIATPTGSTAYSLAAGGSIAHPSLEVVLVTPICPHSLTNRPLILPSQSTFKVTVPVVIGEVLTIIDGQLSFPLEAGDVVQVKKSEQAVRYVRARDKRYFDILRTKLNWGAPNRA